MNHTLDALAWTLIHFCWQAAAIAVVYRVLSFALSRATSQARYVLSLGALFVMIGAAMGTFAWEINSAKAAPSLPAAAAEVRNAALEAAVPLKLEPGAPAQQDGAKAASQLNLLRWIDGLWVLGVVVLSMRSIGGWWLIQRLRSTAVDQAPEAVRASFERISARLGVRREALLRVSSAVAGPITIGALRTMVLLPLSAITLLGPEEMEMVLAHELCSCLY